MVLQNSADQTVLITMCRIYFFRMQVRHLESVKKRIILEEQEREMMSTKKVEAIISRSVQTRDAALEKIRQKRIISTLCGSPIS